TIAGERLPDEGACVSAARDPRVADIGHTRDAFNRVRADPDRWAGPLDRPGADRDVGEPVELSFERRWVVGPERPGGPHGRREACAALGARDPEALQFDGAVAPADTEQEPAAAHHVEECRRLRCDHRMRVWEQVDRGTEIALGALG